MMDKKNYVVPAVEKAHHILMLLANNKDRELKLTDIVSELKYNKSTVFSLLGSMEQLRWVVKNGNATYDIGSTIGRLGMEFFRKFNIKTVFDKEVKELVREINQTMQLSILDGKDIIYLSKQDANQPFQIMTYPGLRIPAYVTAMGKILLSKFSEQELIDFYGEKLEPLTMATVKTVADLYKQIQFYHVNGYIIEREETVLGFTCLAVPIFNDKHEVIAAMSTTLTIAEADRSLDLAAIGVKLQEMSKRISYQLGYHT